MAVAQRITEAEYRKLALEDDTKWELWDGVPREKPFMSIKHNRTASLLGHVLWGRLDWEHYEVRVNAPFARLSPRTYFVPDVAVIPTGYTTGANGDPSALDAYADPLPLVVEVWSPSTGNYDVGAKLRAYQERDDEEIWSIHPFDRTLTAWRRQPDGTYTVTVYHGGTVEIASLPGVAIDLDELVAG